MATVNVLVMLHGMTLSALPCDHNPEYRRLREALYRHRPSLKALPVVEVEWGHELPREVPPTPDDLRPDERLTRAQNFIDDLTRQGQRRRGYDHPPEVGAGDVGAFFGRLGSRFVLRPWLLTPIKRRVMVRGLSDAVYYSSPEGERAARRAVYAQVLAGLETFADETVRLHLVAHSLGVTVAFDFLYGLFAHYDDEPDFIAENRASTDQRVREVVARYQKWREKATFKRLALGSMTSVGGQLPLLMMRKQRLVDRLAARQTLGADVIGIRPGDGPKWRIFYDPDDVLGFPTRRLFADQAAIQEYEVETGWNPVAAHTGYWDNAQVQRETADLIAHNLEP